MSDTMTAFPWRRVVKDSNGITTIHVNEDDLIDFPKFMRFVLKEKHGLDQGVLKIHLDESVVCPTELSSLIELSLKYYSTEMIHDNGKRELPKVAQQEFFYGSFDQDVYGYREKVVNPSTAKSNRNFFLNEIKKPTAFLQKSTSQVLLERSLDSLLDYYWATMRRLSSKSNGMDFQEDIVDMHHLLEVAKTQRQLYGLEESTAGSGTAAEHCYQSHVSQSVKEDNKLSILYGAGVPVGDADCKITPTFSLSSLKTILDVIPTKIPGFSSPYLYFGMEMSSFGWHIEDIAAFSLNALQFGAPCIWFVVPPPFFKLFREWSNNFFLDRSHVACSNVLGASHKYVMASVSFLRELGIPANIVVQEERDIILLYPYAAHSGFKTGINIQQAVNFLDPWSVELSIFAPTCECYDSCVQIDLKEVIALVRPDLLPLYLHRDLRGLVAALKYHKYLQKIGILPSLPNADSDKHIVSCHENSTAHVVLKTVTAPCSSSDCQAEAPDKTDSDLEWKGSRCDIKCPGCPKIFKGGRAKLFRAENHIKNEHNNQPSLLEQLHDMYPIKTRKSKLILCELCGQWKAGGKAQMRLHKERIHGLIV